MDRRTFLALSIGGLAGCTGGSSPDPSRTTTESARAPFNHHGTIDEALATNGDFPGDADPADGRPPAFPDRPSPPDADPSSFETLAVNGETVRLAPIDVVEAWYYRREARFVDARGLDQYTRAHVYGGVNSPAQPGSRGGGIDGWPSGDRVVTYCGCPHHLSSIRAAGLQAAGFSRVYAIDEGFGAWADRGNPMAGTAFEDGRRADRRTWTLTGTVDPRYAGEYAWAAAGRQYEAAPIRPDGSFAIALRFASATAATPVRVGTPAFTVRGPLGDLADTQIDAALASLT